MNIAGQVETDLSFEEFTKTFSHSDWSTNIGRYALRLSGPLGECEFVQVQDGYLLEDGIEAADVMVATQSLSAQLSSHGLRHRFEVYDVGDELVLYVHHNWPLES
jgi:hypothetical protein